MRNVTPQIIRILKNNEVFVFESNLHGDHKNGNAKVALDYFGAKSGIGIGLQGSSYAVPAQGLSLSQ